MQTWGPESSRALLEAARAVGAELGCSLWGLSSPSLRPAFSLLASLRLPLSWMLPTPSHSSPSFLFL